MKLFTIILICLFNFSGAASAYAQSRGVFAAAAAPGQPPTPAAPQPATPQAPVAPRPTTPTPSAPTAQQQQQEQMRIVADPATNSLIVYGTAQEFQNIKNILKDLDAIPRQVLLDVLIMEVSLDDTEDFGVDYEIGRGTTTIFDKTFLSRGAVLGRVLSQVGAGNPSFFPGGISGVIGSNQTVRALINALLSDSRARILSSPSVLATDNRPARIQVGSEEPQATGTLTAATGAITPSQSTTIQYRNTGRIVTIIPQVNSQGLVNLQILAEVSQRGLPVTVGQDSFPSFDIRQAETTAVVQDRDTLAIGGIIAENRSRDRRGIPYLMDIPVLGRFFGSTEEKNKRTELIMLITPNVIRNRNEGIAVTDEFKAKLSGVRSELERLEREQAKMKPKPLPQPPPMPEPNAVQPVPQPPSTNPVPGQGASLPSSGQYNSGGWSPNPDQAGALTPRSGSVEEPPPGYSNPGGYRESVAPKPQGFALSLAPVPVTPVKIAVTKPVGNNKTSEKPQRTWAVQVAACVENKDAELMAERLRRNGHQAYVMTSQVADKIWHRVRIGRYENQNEALELRKILVSEKEFHQAYVAAN
jgi:cell division septation protein DedD